MQHVCRKQKYNFANDDSNIIYDILDHKTIIHTTYSMTLKSVEWIKSSKIHTSTCKTAATYFLLYISRYI